MSRRPRCPSEERAYLHQSFDLVDLGIVERVETLTWLRSHSQNQLNALSVPPRLASVHRLIADAMESSGPPARSVEDRVASRPGSAPTGGELERQVAARIRGAAGAVPEGGRPQQGRVLRLSVRAGLHLMSLVQVGDRPRPREIGRFSVTLIREIH